MTYYVCSQTLPVLHYTFEKSINNRIENIGSGGEKYDAEFHGMEFSTEKGIIHKALYLNGQNYIKLSDNLSENFENFTISVWINTDEQRLNQPIFSFAAGTNRYLILTTHRGNNENGVSLVMTNIKPSTNNHTDREERISNTVEKALSINSWHHIAFTLSGSKGTLFVDGKIAAVKDDFTANPSKLGETYDNYIGKPTWADPYFKGYIDDFRLYDVALPSEEVLRLSAIGDAYIVNEDKRKLTLSTNSQEIESNIRLPERGESGSKIEWFSNNENLIEKNGTVHRPYIGNGDKAVTLTAVLTKGNHKAEKDFNAVIKEISHPLRDLDAFSLNTGNPAIPAYTADASIFYDKQTEMFYAYGTNDGAGGGNVYPPQMWYSEDCVEWTNQIIDLPQSWTDYAGQTAVWAPSFIYNPGTKKYYLMYSIASNTFIGYADHPLGPWEDANSTSPGNLFYRGYDGQFFVDDDNTMYIVTDAWNFKIMKLGSDIDGKLYFDNSDPKIYDETDSNEFVGEYRYKQINEIKNAFEAAFIHKRDNLYYLMWSFMGSENYNVRYAVSESITGPYYEINNSMTIPVLERDDENNILGPGHHSVFEYDDRTFIAYHRQHYPFIDSKRQTCIEEMTFNMDGSINKVIPTHRGAKIVSKGFSKNKNNLASGKNTLVSSFRIYDSSDKARRYRTYGIGFWFTGKFVTDNNYGTRWDADPEDKEPWIIIDLDENYSIDEIETFFEFTSRRYKYKIEYLQDMQANDLISASNHKNWNVFADKTVNGSALSPVIDKPTDNKQIDARFIKLTISGVENLPPTADDWDPVNASNSLSVFEIKVYGPESSDDSVRKIYAENFSNKYGFELIYDENQNRYNLQSGCNNAYAIYENLNFHEEVDELRISFSGAENKSINIEVLRNLKADSKIGSVSLSGKETKSGNQTVTVVLDKPLQDKVENITILLNSSELQKSKNINLNWIEFKQTRK